MKVMTCLLTCPGSTRRPNLMHLLYPFVTKAVQVLRSEYLGLCRKTVRMSNQRSPLSGVCESKRSFDTIGLIAS